jgi:hypothetical protein
MAKKQNDITQEVAREKWLGLLAIIAVGGVIVLFVASLFGTNGFGGTTPLAPMASATPVVTMPLIDTASPAATPIAGSGNEIMFLAPRKPVIYLYPEQETRVTVKLGYPGQLIADYPAYDHRLGGWQVLARPDGTLTNLADQQEYSYLFWESDGGEARDYDWSKGWLVKSSETQEFLQKTLAQIGLTPKEYNEFIVYWYPQMKDNPYNLIHFATHEEYDVHAPLTITPTPDNLLRVFMVYHAVTDPQAIVSPVPQTFSTFGRHGFTVVEWGGSEVK